MARQKNTRNLHAPIRKRVDPLGPAKGAHHYLRWFLDADYLEQLTPKLREYYAQFCDELYMSGSRKPGKNIHSDDGLRLCWKEYKQRQRACCPMTFGQTVVPVRTPKGHSADVDDDASNLTAVVPVDVLWENATGSEDAAIDRLDQKRARARAQAARSVQMPK